MAEAIEVGFSYFDTAPHYGHGLSEVRIGQFLRDLDGDRPVLSTKVGRILEPSGPEGPPDHGFVDPLPFTQRFDYSYDGVMRSFEDSCRRMGVDRFDALFMHDIGQATHGDDGPALFAQAMDGGYRAMDELRSTGATGAIGLGVNEWQVCEASFAHADFDVFMLAGRYTLLEQEPLASFLPACLKRGVSVICAGPLNSGLLASRPSTASMYNYAPVPPEVLARATRLFDFCDAQAVPIQAAALQFPLLHPAVVSVVSGMSTAERVRVTAGWARHPIPAEFWQAAVDVGLIDATAPINPEVSKRLYPD